MPTSVIPYRSSKLCPGKGGAGGRGGDSSASPTSPLHKSLGACGSWSHYKLTMLVSGGWVDLLGCAEVADLKCLSTFGRDSVGAEQTQTPSACLVAVATGQGYEEIATRTQPLTIPNIYTHPLQKAKKKKTRIHSQRPPPLPHTHVCIHKGTHRQRCTYTHIITAAYQPDSAL